MKRKLIFLIGFLGMAFSSFCQTDKPSDFNLSVGADLTTSYLWRGTAQGTGPAIQPWGEFTYKGLTLGTWGSYEFTGAFKEVDLYAKYTYTDFTLLFVDLFFPDCAGLDPNFFNFKNKTTGHAAELGLSFNGTKNIPFSVYGGVILYGTAIDPRVSDVTRTNHSTYFEVNYLGSFKDYSYTVFAGFTPTESVLYSTTHFSVFNVGLTAKKAIKVTDNFSLPIKLTLATNPTSKKIFMAAQLSL